MNITSISLEEITKAKAAAHSGRGNLSELSLAVDALEPGQGFKVDCEWNHSGPSSCNGAGSALRRARLNGIKVTTRCHDGVLYVGRLA